MANTPETNGLSNSPNIHVACQLDINRKIASNYHQFLGKTTHSYLVDFQPAQIEAFALREKYKEGEIVLIDPRINFADQLRLQKTISLDPAVFYEPKEDKRQIPYALLVKSVGRSEESKLSILELIQKESRADWRPATPLVGINAPESIIGKNLALALPGGEIKKIPGLTSMMSGRSRSLVLERYLGNLRITHYYRDTKDDHLSLLLMRGLN